MRYFSFAFEL